MQLILISLLVSSIFGGVLVKSQSNEQKKQPISNRRHSVSRNKLLDINKDLAS